MTTLALYSNKGGVGKTAAAVNLAYLAAHSGYKTLICDLDPQSSTTFYFRVKPKLKRRARGFVKSSKALERSIKGTDYDNLDLLPADFTHRNLDITFDRLARSKRRLNMTLEPLRAEFDLIILDCPPTINILAENIFDAADQLLVPLIPTPLSQRTHQQLLAFLQNNGYELHRVHAFFSMFEGHKRVHREVGMAMFQQFPGMLRSSIPFLPEVEQMGIYQQPVSEFAPGSAAARAFQALWVETQQKVLSTGDPLKAANM